MKNILSIIAVCIFASAQAQTTDSSRFYFDKGMKEKEAAHYLVASVLFERSIQLDPSNMNTYLQLGYTDLAMKRADLAKSCFARVYAMDPSNKIAIRELMDIYFNYRQFIQAIELAGKCPDCSNSQRILGMSYYQQEDYAKAEKYLMTALEKNPNDIEVTYTMGRNYLDMEEYKKAIPYYRKAVNMDTTRNVWMYELGLLYYNLNDHKNALSLFENAEAHGYNRSNDFIENLGYSAIYSGQYEKGEKLLLDIWKRKPGNKDILRDMAGILYEQKQYDRSLTYCQKLMEIDMKDGKALYQAGLCFQKKGEKDRGQQMCDKAIEMDPSLESLRRKKEMPGGL
ncbi:MAG: tetratricopeptide repeat protein [Ferruginibacter sp.]